MSKLFPHSLVQRRALLIIKGEPEAPASLPSHHQRHGNKTGNLTVCYGKSPFVEGVNHGTTWSRLRYVKFSEGHQLETVWRQVAAWCWHRRVACRHAGYRPGANIGTAIKIRKVSFLNIFSGAIPFHRILKIGVWLQVPKETMPCLEKINQLNSQLRWHISVRFSQLMGPFRPSTCAMFASFKAR